MMTLWPPLIVVIIAVWGVAGQEDHGRLVGYDCNNQDVNITVVDLREVGQCADVKNEDVEVRNLTVQVISRKRKIKIRYKTCDVILNRLWYWCGDLNQLFPMPNHFREYRIKFTPKECVEAHKLKTVIVSGVPLTNIVIGQEMRQSISLAGDMTVGYCSRGVYSDGFTHHKATVTGHVKILLATIDAEVELSKNILNVENVARCVNDVGVMCLHPFRGFVGWEYDVDDECSPTSWNVLYEGPATVIDYKTSTYSASYISINNGDTIGSMRLLGSDNACSVPIQRTENNELSIVYQSAPGIPFYFHKKPLLATEVSLFNYANTKFLFLERHIGSSLDSLKVEIVKRMCTDRRSILENRLLLARQYPDAFARLEFGVGHRGIVAGEVLYVLKCTPEVVLYREAEECYADLPVMYNNRTAYITAIERMITYRSPVVECSKRLPISFYIVNDWFGMNPHMGGAKVPSRLDPNRNELQWKYTRLWNFGIAGLYTPDMMRQFETILTSGASKASILSYLAKHSTFTDSQRYDLSRLVSPNLLMEEIRSQMSVVWSWFLSAGNVFSAIMLVYALGKLIITVISRGVDVYSLYNMYGCSLRLIGGISSSVTRAILGGLCGNKEKMRTGSNNHSVEDGDSKGERGTAVGEADAGFHGASDLVCSVRGASTGAYEQVPVRVFTRGHARSGSDGGGGNLQIVASAPHTMLQIQDSITRDGSDVATGSSGSSGDANTPARSIPLPTRRSRR